MKKFFSLFLIILTLVAVTACGNIPYSYNAENTHTETKATKDTDSYPAETTLAETEPPKDPSEEVVDLINEFEMPDFSDLKSFDSFDMKVKNVESAYEALGDEEKQKVTNYDRLVKIREYYQYSYYEYVSKILVRNDIQKNLLNPSSYTENYCSVNVRKSESGYYLGWVSIDYSAQNRMGGYERQRGYYFIKFQGSKYSFITNSEYNELYEVTEFWYPSWPRK